jgi:hypothetical protein
VGDEVTRVGLLFEGTNVIIEEVILSLKVGHFF